MCRFVLECSDVIKCKQIYVSCSKRSGVPVTIDQRNLLISDLVPFANPADHIRILTPAGSTPPEKGVVAHALRYDMYTSDTLQMLIKAFPEHAFLQHLTREDLPD